MGIGLIAAILVSCVIVRELWTGVAFVPWSIDSSPTRQAAERVVRKGERPQAYWLAVGLHCATMAVCWWLLLGRGK